MKGTWNGFGMVRAGEKTLPVSGYPRMSSVSETRLLGESCMKTVYLDL